MRKKRGGYPEKRPFHPRHPYKYNGTMPIICRSQWEYDFCCYLDKHPSVRLWSSESIIIPYRSPLDEKTHRYFPDFLIEFERADGKIIKELIEVKPFIQTQPPKFGPRASDTTKRKQAEEWAKNQAKWQAASGYCKSKGFAFRILTEREIYGKKVV